MEDAELFPAYTEEQMQELRELFQIQKAELEMNYLPEVEYRQALKEIDFDFEVEE